MCIVQSRASAQLPSIPVYLAGCKTVLALQGRTYFQRLWCVLELHIFHQMGGSLEQITFIKLDDDEDDAHKLDDVGSHRVSAFDVRRAQATKADDKARLLAVIEGSGEGIDAFNRWVRNTLLPGVTHFKPAVKQ